MQGNKKPNCFALLGSDVALYGYNVAPNKLHILANAENQQADPSNETKIDTLQHPKPTMPAKQTNLQNIDSK